MPTNKMRAIHPGEILREVYLEELKLTPRALAAELRLTPSRINDIVLERRGVTPDTALRLARFFKTTPEYWLNLQTSYDLKIARDKSGEQINHDIKPIAV